MRVAAAITTFNRLDSLKRCIAHLRAQTRPLDEIIVVDDASQDSTGEWLAGQSDLVVVRMPENRGCSNSFHVAMRTAYERGHDWVYAMDDDVYSTPEALQQLLEAAAVLEGQGVRVGAVKAFESSWGTSEKPRVMVALPRTLRETWRNTYVVPKQADELRGDGPVPIVYCTFCGVLFPRAAFAAAGFPRSEYFYAREDYEFALRLHELGFRNFIVPQALVEHMGGGIKPGLTTAQSAWRYYYEYRNHWALTRARRRILGRSTTLVCRARFVRDALRRAFSAARHGRFRIAQRILQGLVDGMLGRMGKRVIPGR